MTVLSAAPAAAAPPDHDLADQATPLDALLVDAALGPFRRFSPDWSAVRFAAALARQPRTVAGRMNSLAAELAGVGSGRSTVAPAARDRRFADPAWTRNPVLRRIMQTYLAASRTTDQIVGDVSLGWPDDARIRFLTENVEQALAPSNLPLVNPESARAAVSSRGLSILRGGTSLLRDLAAPPRIPEMVDTSPFEVGRNIAVTPGAVVLRTEVLELIQYTPQTSRVREVPVLIVPPTINKFYALDLSPGRSLVEYLVRGGQQVFMISWRNPDARHAGWDLDTYVGQVLGALEAVRQVTGAGQTALMGVCAGGIIASVAAACLTATGQQDQLAAYVSLVTVLDTAQAGPAAALTDRRMAEAAKAMSARRGYLDGRSLAEVFAWLRPGDLIWNYWVNNYLLGKRPPAFDVLFWNGDTTRMTAGLHADFVDLSMDNKLASPGSLTVLGSPVDLSRAGLDAYVVAGIADHLTPWQSCYRSMRLLGGESRFVLSTSGHIAALVNPPGNPKARFQAGPGEPAEPAAWLQTAEAVQGSWWPDLLAWLGDRCGADKTAPRKLGRGKLRPIIDAPGTYVFDS